MRARLTRPRSPVTRGGVGPAMVGGLTGAAPSGVVLAVDLQLAAIAAVGFLVCWWITVPLVIAAVRSLLAGRDMHLTATRECSVTTRTRHGPVATVIIGGVALAFALGPVFWIVDRLVDLATS